MAMGDMAQFMREHTGELVWCARRIEQGREEIAASARHGECIGNIGADDADFWGERRAGAFESEVRELGYGAISDTLRIGITERQAGFPAQGRFHLRIDGGADGLFPTGR